MHGFEVAARLREQCPGIPIVLTSGVYVERPYLTAGRFVGADAYMVNPVDPDELAETLDRLLDASATN